MVELKIFSFKFLQIYDKCQKSLDFPAGFMMYMYSLISKFLDLYLLQLGKHFTGELSCTLIFHYSFFLDINNSSIPTMYMLTDLFRIFLPQRGQTNADFQSPRTILFSHSFLYFLGLG